jgi:hypothetical protein
MEVKWKKVLKDSISEAFSTMYFMVPEEMPDLLDERGDEFKGSWFQSSLSANRDSITIKIWAWGPAELARILSSNILSCEPEDVEDSDMMDAYGEMLNIVVGSVLTAIDPKGEWRMGLPESSHVSAKDLGPAFAQAQDHLFYDLEEHPFICGWRLYRN